MSLLKNRDVSRSHALQELLNSLHRPFKRASRHVPVNNLKKDRSNKVLV